MSTPSLDCASPRTEEAFVRCEEEVRLRARNFWYGLRLLPNARFRALCAVYSWMRRADDLADAEDGLGAEERSSALHAYRERTRSLFAGDTHAEASEDEEHIFVAMREVVSCYELDVADFDKMIEGQLSDLYPRSIANRGELVEYCDQVASTVGRICVRVWNARNETALKVATDRGIAFQMTNILRDIREDFERQRVYLPADELSAVGLDVGRLLAWDDAPVCTRFVQKQAYIAREYYERSKALEKMIDTDCRPTCWAMTTIYRSLLEKIAHRPRLIAGSARIRLSSLRKIAIALRARRLAWYGQGERGEEIE